MESKDGNVHTSRPLAGKFLELCKREKSEGFEFG